jgi:hypothetical protein
MGDTNTTAAQAALLRAWENARAIPHDPDLPGCRCLSCNDRRAERESPSAGGRKPTRRWNREPGK